MKFERRKKQNQHNAGGNKNLLNKHEQKYNKIIKACVKNVRYLGNGFMKYPLTQDQFCWDLQTDFLVNMARNKHDEDVYRLRERKKSSCATGSCSQYDNYLTLRPDFPSENDIRSRRSFYNLSSRKGYTSTPTNPDVDVLCESRSDPYKRRSGKNTRQNSYEELDWNSKSELIPLVNSREMGADSHFIQSRLMLRKTKTDKYPSRKVDQKKREHYCPKENECRTPRYTSYDSMEISTKQRNQYEDENDDKNWNGPLDLPVKTKTPKLSNRRSSPSGNDKNYFAKYTEFVMMKKRQQSISPDKMKNVSCSTESVPMNVSNNKNKRQDLLMEMSNNKKPVLKDVNHHNSHHKINPTKKPLKTSQNEGEREAYYENHNYHRRKHSEKYDSEVKHRKLHSSPKYQGTPEKYDSETKYRKLHSSPKSQGMPEKYDSEVKHRKLHSSPKYQGTPEKYDSESKYRKLHSSPKSQGMPEKYDSETIHRKFHTCPKSQGTPNYDNSKSYAKEIESPNLSDYSKSRYPSNSKHKDYVNKRKSTLRELEGNESHRKDTIASSMKYTKKYIKTYDIRDELKPINDFYAPPDLRSISEVVQAKRNYKPYESSHFLNENIKVKEEREKMGSSSRKQERQSTSRTPERKLRQSTYFNSNVKIDNKARKMRKLDVSSDCGVACDDKQTDKYHNIGLKYGRESVDPALLRKKGRDHRRRGYLDVKGQPTPKTSSKKKGLSAPKERVSFKDENIDFRYDQKNNNDYAPHSPSSVARRPCIKNYTNPAGSETCTECVYNKKKGPANNAKDLSICPIDRKCTTNEAAIVETQLTGVPYLKKQTDPNNVSTPKPKQLFNDKSLKKTKSEDLSKNFCHKTVLEKYPDDAEHLRDYSEEFTKQPFRSTQFNPGGHDPPPLKPTFYPKTRCKPYDYSGNLMPDDKRPNDARKLSPTVYVKRQKRELSYKSTIGENFFKHNRNKYIDIKQSKEPSNENLTTELSTFKSEVPVHNTKTQIVKNKYQPFHKSNEKHYSHDNNYNVNLSAQKNLSFATINEKFRNSDYTESRDRKYDEKLQKSRSEFASRPNSLSSTEYLSDGRTREMKEPDNDVISTILGPSKQGSFTTSRYAVDRNRHNLAKGNKYEIVYLKEKPPATPTNEVPNEKKNVKEYYEPNNREIREEGFYNKSYSEEQPLDKREVLPKESSHIFNKQRNLNDSPEKSPNQPKEDSNIYHHSNNSKHLDSSNKPATSPMKLESPGPSTDWRMQPKLPANDFKMYNVNPNEVEVAPDEKLLPNMIGHAAMHNWDQAESYFFSKNRSKPIVGNMAKVSPHFRKTKLRSKFEDYDDDDEGEEEGKEEGEEEDDYDDDDDDDGDGEETNKVKKKKTKKHMQSIPIIITDNTAPVPAKRFKNQRINPHSRFDAGYDFLQTADSNTSIETVQSYTKKLCTSAVKPVKRESAIKRLAKRLFSIKRKESQEKIANTHTGSGTTESSDEDSPKSIDASSNKPKPKRKVSFSVPLYM